MAVTVAAQRVLQGVAATLTTQFYDQDGNPTAASGTVTVDVTASDGSPLAVGAATTNSGTPPTYQYALAAYPNLDLLTVVWKDGGVARQTTVVEVVGGYYFSTVQARTFDAAITPTLASDAKIIAVRREVEDECERITRQAWVPRFARLKFSGVVSSADASQRVQRAGVGPVRAIRSVQTINSDGTVSTGGVNDWCGWAPSWPTGTSALLGGGPIWPAAGQTIIDAGPWPSTGWASDGTTQTVIGVEYGYDRPPADLLHATLTRLRSRLYMEKTGIPDRATSFSPAEGGNFVIATPGRNGFDTGIPDVDAVYQRYRVNPPAVSVSIG